MKAGSIAIALGDLTPAEFDLAEKIAGEALPWIISKCHAASRGGTAGLTDPAVAARLAWGYGLAMIAERREREPASSGKPNPWSCANWQAGCSGLAIVRGERCGECEKKAKYRAGHTWEGCKKPDAHVGKESCG